MSKQPSRQAGKAGSTKAKAAPKRNQDVQAHQPQTKQARRQDRHEDITKRRSAIDRARRQQAARRRRTTLVAAIVVAAVAVVSILAYLVYGNLQAKHSNGTASASTVAPTATPVNPLYPPVNGIPCDLGEQLATHFHAHLSIYINGKPWTIPANIGIGNVGATCLYWTHTHTSDGVIHIEAPSSGTYTLGDFLEVWGSKFPDFNYSTRLDDASGWTVYVDGKPYSGDFHKIILHEHTLITLAYNSPNAKPDTSFNWGTL